jgi:transcriptional regulator with XRE-family HTH domain
MISFEEIKLHQKIKQIRELKNYTREYVADVLKIDVRSYGYIESGKSNITVKRLYEICNIFSCTIEEILSFNSTNVLNFNVKQENGNLGSNINYQEIKNEKELYLELLKSKDELISFLKQEVNILKKK